MSILHLRDDVFDGVPVCPRPVAREVDRSVALVATGDDTVPFKHVEVVANRVVRQVEVLRQAVRVPGPFVQRAQDTGPVRAAARAGERPSEDRIHYLPRSPCADKKPPPSAAAALPATAVGSSAGPPAPWPGLRSPSPSAGATVAGDGTHPGSYPSFSCERMRMSAIKMLSAARRYTVFSNHLRPFFA